MTKWRVVGVAFCVAVSLSWMVLCAYGIGSNDPLIGEWAMVASIVAIIPMALRVRATDRGETTFYDRIGFFLPPAVVFASAFGFSVFTGQSPLDALGTGVMAVFLFSWVPIGATMALSWLLPDEEPYRYDYEPAPRREPERPVHVRIVRRTLLIGRKRD